MIQKENIKKDILDMIDICRDIYKEKTGIEMPHIKTLFGLRSGTAGRFTHVYHRFTGITIDMYFSFNLVYAQEKGDEFLFRTVIHEYCHYINCVVYNRHGHDFSWKRLMEDIFNAESSEKHKYGKYHILKYNQEMEK